MTFHYVNSLDGINPELYAGDVFVLPNGEMFSANPGDQLGGFWSKFLGIAAPFAAFIPGAGALVSGALSSAAGALEQKEAHKNDASNAVISQHVANLDSVLNALSNGQISSSEALAQVTTDYNSWAEYKMNSASEKDKGYLYNTGELQVLKPKWNAIEAKAAEVAKTEKVKATQTANASANADLPFGLSMTELAIGAVVLYFLLNRS